MESSNWREDYARQIVEERLKSLDENSETIEAFKIHCRDLEIDPKEIEFDYVQTIGVVAKYPNLVSHLMPAVTPDKEGLFDCRTLFNLYTKKGINPGYLYSENHMIMLNSVFRRGFGTSNNWAPDFVRLFWGLSNEEIDQYISLDVDRVRINVDDKICLEKDTWYGAPFDDDISRIPDGTVRLAPPLDLNDSTRSFLFANAHSLDAQWSTKGSIRTFQALEFKDETKRIDVAGESYFPTRYIHAEYDTEQGCFRHFDGAVQFFAEDEYFKRRDSDFKYDTKGLRQIKPRSEKAFKFNGKISVEMWTKFCSHFCSGNPLIYEYFMGDYPDRLKQNIADVRANQHEVS